MRIAFTFSRLLRQLEPTAGSIVKSKLHAGSIRQRLTSSLGLKESRFIGSATRQTAIHGCSDVDLLAVFPRDLVLWGGSWISSDTLVKNVRADLGQRFPGTEIRRDAQAIVVHFAGGSEPVDVVPAIFHSFKTDRRVPVYVIPDGDGGWLETAPAAHNNFIRAADDQSGGKLRRTSQLIKHWRNCRTPAIALSSIHLDLLLAASEICVGPKSYAKCVADTFELLSDRRCRGLQDPIALAGVFFTAKSVSLLDRLIDAVDYAYSHSQLALEAEKQKKWEEAFRHWNIVFNGQFPKR